jgi:hypothetical protein
MSRDELMARIEAFIDARADGSRDDAARDRLLAELSAYQAATVEPYRRLCLASPATTPGLPPALPTDVFRYVRVAAHPPELDARLFRTSGTTEAHRGEHPLRDLALYDRAARAAARPMLFPDVSRMRLLMLAPHEAEAPDSSLSYMLSRFAEWFGLETSWVYRDARLDLEAFSDALERAVRSGEPVGLLGTSFAFVHALDGLGERRFELPDGSRIMQTGGFKGRSRVIEPAEMRALLAARFGVPEPMIVAEYGMTELSSQLYETTLRAARVGDISTERRLWVPGWVRVTPIDPETFEATRGDVPGLLRIDDLANLDSVCALQTSDLARRVSDGVVVLGRAEGATPRGCSLAADAALGRRPC